MTEEIQHIPVSAGLPEFREYMQQKYPDIGEDLITMFEDLIVRARQKKTGGEHVDLPSP